jgi:predicted Zn-dependent peptidase
LCIAYRIGFRLEPEGRTGFAHLFEHMMFEGTPVAPKGTLPQVVEAGGGNLNGDTRWDYTEYIETAPISALDPVLWLEADRLKTLDFSTKNLDNQRQVVEEEVRVNVLNQPYGLFFAIDLPMKAYDTYPDSHNFYGDFHDLDAARIEDVRAFYEKYYAPNNAVLIAHAALFDGNAARVNTIPADIDKVTAADVQAFAQKYLVARNRTVVERNPAPKPPAQKTGE